MAPNWLRYPFIIVALLPIASPLQLNAVVPAAGSNAPIYPNSQIRATWSKTSDSDPTTFPIWVWWWTDALTPFANSVNLGAGSVVASVGSIDSHDTGNHGTYNLAVIVSGIIIATSPVFTVVPSPSQQPAPSTTKKAATSTEQSNPPPATTNQPTSTPTTSPTSQTTQTSSNTGPSSSNAQASTDASSTNTGVITFAHPSSTDTSSQASGTGAATGSEQNNQNPGSSTKKVSTGAIAGGAVGGVVLVGAIAVLIFFLLRRRRRASDSVIVDTSSDDIFNRTIPTNAQPFEKQGRLAAVIREREEAQRQQDLLQADLRNQRASQQFQAGPTQREALLMQQNQLLAERIVALESQQREIEDRLAQEAPPDYATAYRPGSRVL